MEKEIYCQLKKMLDPVAPGKVLFLHHHSGWEMPEKKLFSLPDPCKTRVLLEHYDLYPGIGITFNRCIGQRLSIHHTHKPSVLKVDHCNLGRIGWNMGNGQSLYMGKETWQYTPEPHVRDPIQRSPFLWDTTKVLPCRWIWIS